MIYTLSLWQPWASLVACSAKKIETRSWRPSAAAIGQRIAIHAAKSFPRSAKDVCYEPEFFDALWPILKSYGPDDIEKVIDDLPRGVMLCTVSLRGAWSTNDEEKVDRLSDQERAFGNYAPGRWAWELEEVQPVSPPVAARGKLGLWQWEPALAEATP